MRIPLFLTAALLVAACGDPAPTATDAPGVSSTTTSTAVVSTTTAAPPPAMAVDEIAGFVISAPPAGYRAIGADDGAGGLEVSYGDRGCGSSDWNAQVRVTDEFDFFDGRDGGHEPQLLADGTPVEILDMWDDGRAYGAGASWELGDGRWVTIRYVDEFSVDQLRAGIDSLVPIDGDERARLLRALGPTTGYGGGLDVAGDEVVVTLDDLSSGDPVSVTFHRPADFPLGDDDCRRACYSIEVAGAARSVPQCDARAERVKVGEFRFVAAQVAPAVASVAIDIGSSTLDVATVAVPGMPARFYAAEVPVEACGHTVTSPDADFGLGLGQGGVTPSDPDRAGCVFAPAEPVEYEPPTECNEVEQDWVASTTSLRPIDCPVDLPAAASTTTQPAADDDG